jgi:hypothetical protein
MAEENQGRGEGYFYVSNRFIDLDMRSSRVFFIVIGGYSVAWGL